jgi:hypothetical protein
LSNNCYRRHNYYDYIGQGGRTGVHPAHRATRGASPGALGDRVPILVPGCLGKTCAGHRCRHARHLQNPNQNKFIRFRIRPRCMTSVHACPEIWIGPSNALCGGDGLTIKFGGGGPKWWPGKADVRDDLHKGTLANDCRTVRWTYTLEVFLVGLEAT